MVLNIGELISVRYFSGGRRWIGLVIDQEEGKKWADRDPCMELGPNKDFNLLVRVLGNKLSEGTEKFPLLRTGLPEREPCSLQTVRWAYVHNHPSAIRKLTSNTSESLEDYIYSFPSSFCRSSLYDSSPLRDIKLVREYFDGVKRKKEGMSEYDRLFLEMLKEVLPLPV